MRSKISCHCHARPEQLHAAAIQHSLRTAKHSGIIVARSWQVSIPLILPQNMAWPFPRIQRQLYSWMHPSQASLKQAYVSVIYASPFSQHALLIQRVKRC